MGNLKSGAGPVAQRNFHERIHKLRRTLIRRRTTHPSANTENRAARSELSVRSCVLPHFARQPIPPSGGCCEVADALCRYEPRPLWRSNLEFRRSRRGISPRIPPAPAGCAIFRQRGNGTADGSARSSACGLRPATAFFGQRFTKVLPVASLSASSETLLVASAPAITVAHQIAGDGVEPVENRLAASNFVRF